MNCEKYSNLIDDLVSGELPEQTAARARSHFFACPNCRERYDALKREREIYARYLFAVEPSPDLWANFQARLAAEKKEVAPFAETPAPVFVRRKSVFDFSRWSPAFAGAAVLLVAFGIIFGWLKFAPTEKVAENETVAETDFSGNQPTTKNPVEIEREETVNSPIKSADGKTKVAPKRAHVNDRNKSLNEKNMTVASLKLDAVKAKKASRNLVSQNQKKDFAGENGERSTEEKVEKLRLQNLETETARQIEKVELLLRSFRNARAVEGVESFDVAYEKQQARKLLDANVRLRHAAEAGGNFYAEELLSRAESHLLDIANLEENPAPDKVLDIKERVKNQNIIASLQIY